MKKQARTMLALLLIVVMVCAPAKQSHAIGIYEIIKAAVTKVIKAVDLKIQRMQNKTIWLQNAQKELENKMSKLKLGEISQWTEKQRQQYDAYFKELWRVKNALATYKKVKTVTQRQLQIIEEYRRAWSLLQKDKHFEPKELEYMYKVYSGVLEESMRNLDQLMLVINSFRTQMSDGKRMELIAQVDKDMETTLIDLRKFSDRNFRLSISRSADQKEADYLKKIYGLK